MAMDFWDRLGFMGAGMAQNNMLGAMSRMHQINQQAEALRQAQERMVLAERARQEQMRQQAQYRAAQLGIAQQRLAQPTSAMQNVEAYQAASPELRAIMDKMPAFGGGPPGAVVNMGSIPTGFQNVGTKEAPKLQPIPGSPEQIKRETAVAELETMLSVITELEGLVQQHGTEMTGDVADQMQTLRNRYIGNINMLRETGVLQEGELKRLEDELPDPTGWAGVTTRTSNVLNKYGGARQEVQDKLGYVRKIYGMEAPTPSAARTEPASGGPPGLNLPPGWTIEKVK